MIEINLLPGPKRKKAAGPSLSINFDALKAVFASVKDPLMVGAVSAWTVALLAIAYFYFGDTRRMAVLSEELTRVEAEQKRFQIMIDQKRKAEKLRDSLIAELEVIRQIDGERFVWPHIFEEIGRALPDYTWLTSIQPAGSGAPAPGAPGAPPQPAGVRFNIEGRTSDIQAYTRFLRQLSNSPWLTNVVAGPTSAVVEQDRPVTSFFLTAEFRRADSAYIRTAPVTQTVR